ncbi:MAG: hypothetical protein ACKOHK_13195 [Planctomycetia bacterium]
MATLVLGVETGLETTVATVGASATVAAVAGNGTRITAHEGDGDESNEHGETESEKTLHHIPPDENIERVVRSLKPSRNNLDPGRPPDRSNRASNETTRGTEKTSMQPVALP